MNSKRVGRRSGVVLALAGLVLAGVVSLPGRASTEAQARAEVRGAAAAVEVSPGVARADQDTLDLQLD
jgi:hypothetical protein